MAADFEDPAQLLARLEVDLAGKQVKVDARIAGERAQLDALEREQADFLSRRERAEAELQTLGPMHEELLERRHELRRGLSIGNPVVAAIWSVAAMGLTAGAVIPLAVLVNIGGPFFSIVAGGFAATLLGWGLTAIVTRKWR